MSRETRRYGDGVLAARDLHLKRYGRGVLQDVSFTAHPGRVLALIGPNGAGKSSLLGVLAGWVPASRGDITLDGRPMGAWTSAALARRRAMLSQHVDLDFAFRAEEVVMLGCMTHGRRMHAPCSEVIIDAAMCAAHAAYLKGRNYLELSGGEQRLVQLARVLAQVWGQEEGPAWLLLDEPEAGLDIAHQHVVLSQMRELSRQGYGVIVVLHDLNLAARYADEVALMAQGRLVRMGSVMHALDPSTLSKAYGVSVRRLLDTGGEWALVSP